MWYQTTICDKLVITNISLKVATFVYNEMVSCNILDYGGKPNVFHKTLLGGQN